MKYFAINFFLSAFILLPAGCGTTAVTHGYVTITRQDLSEEAINYLKKRGSRIEICDNGIYKIYNSAQTRDAILRMLEILHSQATLIANNIANTETTETKSGGPYRRQFIKFNEDGTTSIEKDMSEFLQVYNPDHPCADNKGMVKFPNIHLTLEMFYMKWNTCQIYIFKEILERFDKTFVNNWRSDRQIQTFYDSQIKEQQTRSFHEVILSFLASIRDSCKKEPERAPIRLGKLNTDPFWQKLVEGGLGGAQQKKP